jgi:hypothetical protein
MKSNNPTPIMDEADAFAQRSFNIRSSENKKLKTVAHRLGCSFRGEPSVGRMLRQIATGKLKVVKI